MKINDSLCVFCIFKSKKIMLKPNYKLDHQPNSLPLNECLAKTYKSISGEYLAGRQVLNHIHIVGEVAKELLNRMPPWLVTELFPSGVNQR